MTTPSFSAYPVDIFIGWVYGATHYFKKRVVQQINCMTAHNTSIQLEHSQTLKIRV